MAYPDWVEKDFLHSRQLYGFPEEEEEEDVEEEDVLLLDELGETLTSLWTRFSD